MAIEEGSNSSLPNRAGLIVSAALIARLANSSKLAILRPLPSIVTAFPIQLPHASVLREQVEKRVVSIRASFNVMRLGIRHFLFGDQLEGIDAVRFYASILVSRAPLPASANEHP